MKQSIRSINRDTGIHRTIIRNLNKVANNSGWLSNDRSIPSENEIHQALVAFDLKKSSKSHGLDPLKPLIKDWLAKNHSFVVIHKLIQEHITCSESTVRRFIHQHFPKQIQPIMIRQHIPGECAEVDFGYLGLCFDPESGKNRRAWVFSLRLRHSRKAYREVVFDQSTKTFLACHIHAFEWLGGVPTKIVIDNLKAGVTKASLHEPLLNRSYQQLAEHYAFIISPCLPYKPQHKGGVENDIKYIKRNFLSFFLESQAQKGIEVPSKADFQKALDQWNCEVSEKRKIGGVDRTPQDLFEEEKEHLKSLPSCRWDALEWYCTIVGKDWRVRFDKVWYSVPYAFIGKEVQVCASQSSLKIFHAGQEIAMHLRSYKPNDYVRINLHAPLQQEEVLNATRGGLLAQAETIGPSTLKLSEELLNDPSHDKLRPVRLILKLALRYSPARLEKACKRALIYGTISYTSIKAILEKALDQKPFEEQSTQLDKPQKYFKFARDPQYFTQGAMYG
ncbi:putative transposase [Neochlamydia sp. EPS4]|uniref:IS21 family transposase n=1 Tax=Neochlamydia sp. EPS4 TaxID=1478175 RepID=UPI000582E3CE|nr:IS21 family transposase [Neochlamydia sp. EPS4]KIC73709.1 putative transposase [Neochlamydia sp. EPS4]